MPLTVQFVGSAQNGVSASLNIVDISAIPIERGDIAIAMLAFGNPAAIPASGPEGWTRITGDAIRESDELAGELISRVLLGTETELSFSSQAGGPFAAIIAVYRNVSGVDAVQDLRENIESGPGAAAHPSPSGFSNKDGLAVFPYFFWYAASPISEDAATVAREDVEVIDAPHRSIALLLADEQAPAGALASRTATAASPGLANTLLIALKPAEGERSPFGIDHGDGQGRVEDEGLASFVLGHDRAGEIVRLSIGDYRQAVQDAEIPGAALRARVRLRAAPAPAGAAWEASLLIDGTKRASRIIGRDEEIELAANTSALGPGEHQVALRLELVAA